ncbi:MAG: T9SS type A sorting domain-containing protein, partial [Cytophagales bacterium]
SPEFTLIPGTLANTYTIGGGNVRQSYEIYEDDVTVKSELFTVLHYLPTFTGSVFNWGNSVSPIINNTNTLSGLLNATALENCVSLGKTSGTDATGTFVVEMGEGNYGVSIQRDIPNNTPVMDVINANDALTITRIANNALRNPSALQLIAADVNGSGSITSGDRTLVQRRTLMLIKQFPNNVPDWKFYIITSTFTGFNRNRIPNVLTCIPLSSFVEDGCVKLNNQSFVGVLMGNVDGIYTTNLNGGKNLRVEGEDQVIYDLSSALTDSEGVTNLPVKLNYVGSVYAFDASIEYDEAAISIESILLSDQNDVSAGTTILYNHFKTNHLLATVDKFEGLTNGAQFATIKLKKSTSTLKAADLGKLDAFINGNRVSVIVNEDAVTSTTEASLTNLRIYPNPSESGIFNIDLPNANSTTSFEVFNSIGNPILHSSAKPFASSALIDLSSTSSGIYFLKISNGSNVVIKKIVVE